MTVIKNDISPEIYKISVNQSILKKLAPPSLIKLFKHPRLDRNGEPVENFTSAHFEKIQDAAEIYHQLGTLKVPAFRNWIG